MKSLAKAAIIIACLLLSGYMVTQDHEEFAIGFFVFGVAITVFYEAQWK